MIENTSRESLKYILQHHVQWKPISPHGTFLLIRSRIAVGVPCPLVIVIYMHIELSTRHTVAYDDHDLLILSARFTELGLEC